MRVIRPHSLWECVCVYRQHDHRSLSKSRSVSCVCERDRDRERRRVHFWQAKCRNKHTEVEMGNAYIGD